MSGAVRDDAGLLTTPPPDVTDDRARAVARAHYGLEVEVARLPGERDCNVLLRDAAGTRRVLKVFGDAEDAEARHLQCGVLLHLARSGLSCETPRLLRTVAGEEQCRFDDGGRTRHGILLSHLQGTAAAMVEGTAALRERIGATAANLDRALATCDRPGGTRVLLWDPMRLDRLAGAIGLVAAGPRRDWLARFVDDFLTDVRPRVARFRTQLIHADLNLGNILVDPRDGTRVAGIIDFGDVVRAPLISEVAILANYHMDAGHDPFAALGDILGGYERHLPLIEDEVAALFDLVLARLAVRLLIYAWRADLFPGNRDYILRNSAGAHRLLDRVADVPRERGREAVLALWKARRSSR